VLGTPAPVADCTFAPDATWHAQLIAELNATTTGRMNGSHVLYMHEILPSVLTSLVQNTSSCGDVVIDPTDVMDPNGLFVKKLKQHALFMSLLPSIPSVLKQVQMTVRVGITASAFDAARRLKFRLGVASTAGVSVLMVRIVRVQSVSGARRLLSEALDVQTIVLAGADSVDSVVEKLQNTNSLLSSVREFMGGDLVLSMAQGPTVPNEATRARKPSVVLQTFRIFTGTRLRELEFLGFGVVLLFVLCVCVFFLTYDTPRHVATAKPLAAVPFKQAAGGGVFFFQAYPAPRYSLV
jgi:hypothetical protein